MEETCEGGIHWSSGTPISSDSKTILKKWMAGIMPGLEMAAPVGLTYGRYDYLLLESRNHQWGANF